LVTLPPPKEGKRCSPTGITVFVINIYPQQRGREGNIERQTEGEINREKQNGQEMVRKVVRQIERQKERLRETKRSK